MKSEHFKRWQQGTLRDAKPSLFSGILYVSSVNKTLQEQQT